MNKTKLKEYFFVNPVTRLRVRQIEREVKISLPSAIRYAKELEEEEILKSENIAGVKFYSANRSSENFLLEKKLFNIGQLHTSGLIEYLKNEHHNPVIVLFGSYSRGEDISGSDIDLYIETSKVPEHLEKYEKILRRKLQIFRNKSIRHIKNKELSNNIINGVVLNGFIEVL